MSDVQREALRQHLLLRAIVSGDDGLALQGWVGEAPSRMRRGLRAYQANRSSAAKRALEASFPTLMQLIGKESFAALARAYVRAHPPARGDLAWLGEALPAFVAASESLRDEPYLADVARLEWAVQQAECAADGNDASPEGMELLADTDPARLRMAFRPGTAVVASKHPIASIWLAHRSDAVDRFALVRAAFAAGRGECALVWRDGWRAQVAEIGAAEARFAQAALDGRSLAEALDAAGPEIDFEALLVRALRERWLASILLFGEVEETFSTHSERRT